MTYHQLTFVALWLGICAYGATRGGTPERITATLFFVGALLSKRLESSPLRPFAGFEIGIFSVDASMFGVLLIVALFSTRFWPLVMTSFQGAQLMVHLGRWLGPGILPKAYFATAVIWSFPMLILLSSATYRHQLRRKRLGFDYSWISQLPAAYRAGRLYAQNGSIAGE